MFVLKFENLKRKNQRFPNIFLKWELLIYVSVKKNVGEKMVVVE